MPAVAVLAGERPAVPGHQPGRVGHEVAHDPLAAGLAQREVEPQVQAPVAEVPVRQPGEPVLPHELLELAQVPAQFARRNRGVLPARVGRLAVRRAPGEPGAILPDPPQHGRPPRVGDEQRAGRAGPGVRQRAPGQGLGFGGRARGELGEQPSRARRQRVHRSRAPLRPHHVGDPRVQALAGGGLMRGEARRGIRGAGHVRVPGDRQHPAGRLADQAQRGLRQQGQRSLAADQRPAHVEPVLRQQVLERVTGHLPAEPPELGPDRREPAVDDLPQRSQFRRFTTLAGQPDWAGHSQGPPCRGEHVQRQNVV